MICSISLANPLKKIYGSKCMQVSPAKAVSNLSLDPEETGIDALVVQPKDLSFYAAKQLVAAINERHPGIKVIYIYTKDQDAGKLSDVEKHLLKSITPEALKDAIDSSLAGSVVSEKSIAVASNDKRVLERKVGKDRVARNVESLNDNVSNIKEKEELEEELHINDEENEEINILAIEDDGMKESSIEGDPKIKELFEQSSIPKISPEETSYEDGPKSVPLTIEQRLNRISEVTDWNVLNEACELERIKVDLMNESSQYAGSINYMQILEAKVNSVFNDDRLTAEEKMLKIREIGVEKSGVKAQANNMLVSKYQKVLDAITNLICRDMDARILNIKSQLNKLVVKQDFFTREGDVRDLIDKRLEIQVSIGEFMEAIIQTYKIMNSSANDIIAKMDEDLPTESKYVNEIMKPYASYFKPENAGELFMELTRAVEEKRLVLSSIENKLQSLFTAVFKLIEVDETIINHYKDKIDIFKAQNTEEVIVMTTAMKSALRLYIGPKDVGLTTTALIMSGCLSRRRNTVLLDLRKVDKLSNYKVNTINIDTFLTTKVEEPFVICKEAVEDVDRLEEILRKLNDKLYYYYNINIVLDDDQLDFVERLGSDLRTIIYVTNCTPKALLETKEIVSKIHLENVAQKIVEIAPPIDPVEIALKLGIDATRCQVTTVPYMIEVARCTAEGEIPFYKPEIRTVYEKGMRM